MNDLNLQNLDKRIAEKYINVQKHPTLDLYIYNYSHKAQYDNVWDHETESCRGLIMDGNRRIFARPFKKFFNLSQVPELPAEPFTVTEKLDGSLGIMYPGLDGLPAIATRGSFTSDQAMRATAILRSKYKDILHKFVIPEFTYLFEILIPENRIVVDYGDTEDIVLLTVIVTQPNSENYFDQVQAFGRRTGMTVVKQYDGLIDIHSLPVRENAEGYVVRFQSGLRVKVKFDEYVRLHRILTNVNAKAIWDLLRNGQGVDELLERVPDEFYNWVRSTVHDLQADYTYKEELARGIFANLQKENLSRRDFAAEANQLGSLRSVLFAMLDGKDYSQIIWKQLRPEATKPFKVEE